MTPYDAILCKECLRESESLGRARYSATGEKYSIFKKIGTFFLYFLRRIQEKKIKSVFEPNFQRNQKKNGEHDNSFSLSTVPIKSF